MATAQLRDPAGAEKGKIELPAELFESKIHRHAMWLAVNVHLTNQRQGTSKVKGRKEVKGGGVKPWRQKGTGRARSGTIRSPIWVGGARAFGPVPRDHHEDLPKKVRRLAFRSALSVRAKEGKVHVITDAGVKDGRTQEVAKTLKALGVAGSACLFIVDSADSLVVRAGRNIPWLVTASAAAANTYEVLRADHVVMTQAALETLKKERVR